MPFLGKSPPPAALTASDITDGIISEAKMANDAISLAELKAGTDGNIISYDTSGNPVAVATGNDGQVLTSAGAGQPPAFEASSGSVTAINNATENEIVTIGSTTTELDAEAKLLFDGTNLVLGNGTAEDTYFRIDGNAFNFNIILDDSVDGVGFGTSDGGIGTNSALCIDSNNNLTVGQSPTVGSATPFMIRGDGTGNGGQQTATVYNAGIVFSELRSGNESVWSCGPDADNFYIINCTDDPAAVAFTIDQSEVVAGDFNDTSDVALKENIVSIDTAIDTVKQLRPVTFDWKRIGKGSTSGFIAQEVELLLPNVVKGDNFDSSDRTSIGKSLNATGVLSHVTKALQEAITKIETLETKVAALEKENN